MKPNSEHSTNGWLPDADTNRTQAADDDYYTHGVRHEQKTKGNQHRQNPHDYSHHNDDDSDLDDHSIGQEEIQQNWEILKNRPLKTNTNDEKNAGGKNSSTRNEPNIKYDEWTSVKFPSPGIENEIYAGETNEEEPNRRPPYPHFDSGAVASSHKENVSKTTVHHKITPPQRHPADNDDVVIGLSPPPLRQPPRVVPTQKLPPTHPHPKPVYPEPKPGYSRPPIKNRPKPTNPPYPFEKPKPNPSPSSVPTSVVDVSRLPKPSTVFGRPASNVLYETDAPNFGAEEAMKLKPLNATAKIEPVKKWPPTQAPTSKPLPVFGSVVKVQEIPSEHSQEPKRTTANNGVNQNDAAAQSDVAKIIVVEKPTTERTMIDKTTELISKWNEIGVVSSSKNDDLEDYDDESKSTPQLKANRTRTNTAPNSIFGNLFTRPPPANIVIIPTQRSTTQHYSAISVVIDQEQPSERDSDTPFTFNVMPHREQISSNSVTASTAPTIDSNSEDRTEDDDEKRDGEHQRQRTDTLMAPTRSRTRTRSTKTTTPSVMNTVLPSVVPQSLPTYYVTHTKTLSVTITQTTVIERDGHPSTHTVILTKTHTSTIVDTVTKIETLVRPTGVLSTVITTTVPVTLPPKTDSSDSQRPSPTAQDTDSIFVVMTDNKKQPGTAQISPAIPAAPTDTRPAGFEVQVPDEANEISPNDILFSGIYTQHAAADNECKPECKVTKNEMCQRTDNSVKCVCRPGFARIFPDHPCKRK